MSAVGALIGLFGALGALVVIARSPVVRRVTLTDRIAPFVLDAVPRSLLLDSANLALPQSNVTRLTRPLVEGASRRLDRLIGRNPSIRRRLAALGDPITVETFRQEQVLWAAAGAAVGLALLLLRHSTGVGPAVLSFAGFVFVATFGGFIARDYALTKAVKDRDTRMAAELPAIAELLALAVGAGESPLAALERVVRRSRGELGRELAGVVADARAGRPFAQALSAVTERTALPGLTRFVDGITVALARGTPIAEVLRAQANDAREEGRRNLLEAGGKREIAMMVPVVFLVLPVTILFALFPGAVTLTSISQ